MAPQKKLEKKDKHKRNLITKELCFIRIFNQMKHQSKAGKKPIF